MATAKRVLCINISMLNWYSTLNLMKKVNILLCKCGQKKLKLA